MIRRLLRELLPNQRKAEVLKQEEPSGATGAIRSFQQRLKHADKHEKLPERSEKHDPDRTDVGQQPARDCHEWPSGNPRPDEPQ